jgi:hypothetical protein
VSGAAGTEISSGPVPCANHPNVETGVRCSDCGKPICPDCMVQSAVGIKCRDCARLPRSARVTLKPDRAAKAVLVSLGLGTVIGLLLGGAGTTGIGFFSFIVAFIVGLAIGRAVLWASGRYRSEATAWIAVAGAAWAYIVPAIVISIDTGLGVRFGIQGLGLLIAAFIAYREAS